jgi:hypothetical protein
MADRVLWPKVAILCAIGFCPINDLAVKLLRRTGKALVTLFDDIARQAPYAAS